MFKEVPSQFDFPKIESEILAFWEENRVYDKSLEQRKGCKPFVFFEGPPTANGLPHPGHCLTRAIKDLFPRYKTMTGHHCLRKAGWDTHGLPVEVEVCKELGIHSKEEIEAYGIEEFNRKCLESVFRYTQEWEEMTRRLGFWINLDEAYVTYHQSYVESVWWSLKKLFDAGLLYKGHKIVWWWAQGGTALSAGEVGLGYREVDDPSVFVRFPLVQDERFHALFGEDQDNSREPNQIRDGDQSRDRQGAVGAQTSGPSHLKENPSLTVGALNQSADDVKHSGGAMNDARISLLVWTTTPWTLPSNMFAAVNEDFEYALVVDEDSGERLIFAKALVESIAKKLKATDRWKIERTFKGSELVGLRYLPPFDCYYNYESSGKSQAFDISDHSLNLFYAEFGLGPVKMRDAKLELKAGGNEYVGWRVLSGNFVTLDAGTGLVHQAPAFGEVDFDLLQEERQRFAEPRRVPLPCAVAPNGTFTDEFPKYKGRWVKDCDKDICRDLKERGLLLYQEQYRHDYPFCWRAEQDPLIQYPRKSWFIRTTQFKEDMLENNRHIHWLPEHIKTGRFGKFLESNVDWSLSRERYWGTPLPIWVCESCGHAEAIDSYGALVAKPGIDGLEVWETAKRQSPDLSDHLKVHKPYIDAITYDCPQCATGRTKTAQAEASGSSAGRMKRVTEVIDCWYDAGSMPFAQWGFPHQSAEEFAQQFPADFISEALDQTRGWFYSLTAIATMLFGSDGVARDDGPAADYPIPFRNCIVLGLLMGEDGLKMSKSKKNYKEPGYIFEKEGADAMRWLFFSGQAPWTSIRFQESAIAEAQREFLIRLYNCYSFFVLYANIDKWTPDQSRDSERAFGNRNHLDRWIRSELSQCCCKVFDHMEHYDNYNASRALSEFVDALSNWYVRRSRDRFWRSEMDADKRAAYGTLHHCLVTVSKLIAPFTPFIAESMYQNLVRTHDADAPSSVHLCDYPIAEDNSAEIESQIDAALNEEIALVRQLVSCGRAARSAAKLRVRQPLAGIQLYHRSAETIQQYEDIIRDELNVKRIEHVPAAEIDKYVHYDVKPDFKKIGPKHGPLAPRIKAALSSHPNVDGVVKQLEQTGSYTIEVNGQDVELTADELFVELHAREGYAAERIPGCGILVLDTQITPELLDEGWARDMVNKIQQIRKKLDLRYEQHIDLAITGDDDIARVVNTQAEYIRGETLAQTLLNQPIEGGELVKVDIGGHAAEISVKPV